MKSFLPILLVALLLLTGGTSSRKTSKNRNRNGGSDRHQSDSGGRRRNDSPSTSTERTNSHSPSQNNNNDHLSKSTSDNKNYLNPVRSSSLNNQRPIGWDVTQNRNYAKKETSRVSTAQRDPAWGTQTNKNTPQTNQRPIGWDVSHNTKASQSNPAWNTHQQQHQQTPTKGGWSSGYQSHRSEPAVKKETSKVQQSAPHQPQPPQPGWNTGHQQNSATQQANSGWKNGYQTQGAPPAYPHHNAAPPGYNGQTSWGAPPAYPGHAPGYGGYNGFGHGNQQPGGYGGFGHGNQQPGGYGGYNGFGHGNQQPGGYGGYGGYHPQQSFGGGYGAVGGFGGHGGGFGSPSFGGYNQPRKSSFFSASTIGSVVAGMLIYNTASSLISYGLGLKKPYTVVNYYNQEPGKKVEELQLPSNVLTLCQGDVTKLCGQGTQSVCTNNGTVLCVATMNHATPCDQNGNRALCVNTTIPCSDANDPLCQNSTNKDKLEADVSLPCVTNLTLDVNLVDKDQTAPNTKYTYCITTMAIAGPDYKLCQDFKDSNDYRSVLEGANEWFLETNDLRRNYSVYTHARPMESNGNINMPVGVLVKCPDDALKLCAPGTIATCTTFNEVMCLTLITDVTECPEKNTTCVKSEIPCPSDAKESFCQNKTEGEDKITWEVPCFANISLTSPFPKFSLAEFNGTLPEVTAPSSYSYNFNYCVTTLAIPGSDFDLCITKDGKEKRDKEQAKS